MVFQIKIILLIKRTELFILNRNFEKIPLTLYKLILLKV